MSTTRPPDRREISRSSRSAISGGGRSLVSTIWCPAPCSASVSRNSSDCISLRFERNCTSSTSSTSTFWKRRRNASPRPDGGVERLHVLVQGQVFDVQGGRERLGRLADGHEEVRFPEAGAAINEERVVGRARVLGDRTAGRDGKPVRRPDHERLEGVFGVERRGHAGLPA